MPPRWKAWSRAGRHEVPKPGPQRQARACSQWCSQTPRVVPASGSLLGHLLRAKTQSRRLDHLLSKSWANFTGFTTTHPDKELLIGKVWLKQLNVRGAISSTWGFGLWRRLLRRYIPHHHLFKGQFTYEAVIPRGWGQYYIKSSG